MQNAVGRKVFLFFIYITAVVLIHHVLCIYMLNNQHSGKEAQLDDV